MIEYIRWVFDELGPTIKSYTCNDICNKSTETLFIVISNHLTMLKTSQVVKMLTFFSGFHVPFQASPIFISGLTRLTLEINKPQLVDSYNICTNILYAPYINNVTTHIYPHFTFTKKLRKYHQYLEIRFGISISSIKTITTIKTNTLFTQ